jgi:chromosome segregation ATPase
MTHGTESSLLAAARALSEDLERFEKLSGELSRLVINSDKTLQRARRGLLECSEHEGKLAESLRGFALAMQSMQAMQQRCLEQTAEATERVRQRQEQRARLQERLQQLGRNAGEISGLAAALPESPERTSTELLGRLQEVAQRLESVIAEAAAVAELAHDEDWSDVERDTNALKQQLLAAKNRVRLSLSKLAEGAPS